MAKKGGSDGDAGSASQGSPYTTYFETRQLSTWETQAKSRAKYMMSGAKFRLEHGTQSCPRPQIYKLQLSKIVKDKMGQSLQNVYF